MTYMFAKLKQLINIEFASTTMKNIKIIFPILIIFFACNAPVPKEEDSTDQLETVSNDLMGTWKLISSKSGADSFFIDVPSMLIYRKHITPLHYSVVSYDAGGDNIYYTIGGTYTVNGDKYIENIQYFHPYQPGITGTSVKFNSKVENDRWHVDGYIKNVHLDPETQEYIKTDSTRIAEVWEKM